MGEGGPAVVRKILQHSCQREARAGKADEIVLAGNGSDQLVCRRGGRVADDDRVVQNEDPAVAADAFLGTGGRPDDGQVVPGEIRKAVEGFSQAVGGHRMLGECGVGDRCDAAVVIDRRSVSDASVKREADVRHAVAVKEAVADREGAGIVNGTAASLAANRGTVDRIDDVVFEDTRVDFHRSALIRESAAQGGGPIVVRRVEPVVGDADAGQAEVCADVVDARTVKTPE